ncbi:MAG: hypothetical protein LBS21_10020 [Clostridiales bacterium]|jgi:hypothetical protein|nr:hypothetical protein [Clostridiales bacterium]
MNGLLMFQKKQIQFFEKNCELALIAPILSGILYSTKQEAISGYGTHKEILLHQLARIYKDHDGMYGICFEYAVHHAIRRNEPSVISRINQALKMCNVLGSQPSSVHLGFEKSNILQITSEAKKHFTSNSMLIFDEKKEPIRILDEIDLIEKSFRQKTQRNLLKAYMSDIWKSDLFIGNTDSDMWVAASVKVRPRYYTYYRGVRIEIIPARWNKEDKQVYKHKNGMIYCYLPYDNNFVQHFYTTWIMVSKVLNSDAKVPVERYLPLPKERKMALYLESRREYPVYNIIEELNAIAQNDIMLPIPPEKKLIELSDNKESLAQIIIMPAARLIRD